MPVSGKPRARRERRLNIRLSDRDSLSFSACAEKDGVSLAEWVRRTCYAEWLRVAEKAAAAGKPLTYGDDPG